MLLRTLRWVHRMTRRTFLLLAALVAALVAAGNVPGLSAPADAARFQVRSETVGQLYQQLTSDRGLLNRRRLSQRVGLAAYDLTGDESDRIALVTSLRIDSDFGLSAVEVDRTRGLTNHDLTLLMGYVEARDIVPWTTVRIGRQLLADPASGLLLLDGLHARIDTPWFVSVETVVGLEARAGVLTASALELDGPEESDGPTLVVGGALVVRGGRPGGGVSDIEARVDYQRWLDAAAPDRIDREVLAGSLYWRPRDWLLVSGDARWDFFVSAIDSARAAVRVRPLPWLEVEADYDHYLPVFRATSIWNVFAADAYDEMGGRLSVRVTEALRAWFGAGARRYGTPDLEGGRTDVVLRGGGELAAGDRTAIRVEILQEGKSGGLFRLVDVGAEHAFPGWRAGLEGRVTVLHVEDPRRAERATNAFGVALGGWFRVRDVATFHLLVEDNESALQRNDWRVLAIADLEL